MVARRGLLDVIPGFQPPLSVGDAELQAGSIQSAKLQETRSGVLTGTGSPQNFAHGLGVAPSDVVVVPTGGHDGAGGAGTQFPTVTLGTHTTTNVVVTVSAGAKFYVLARL